MTERKWVTFEEQPQLKGHITKSWNVLGSGGDADVIGVVRWSPTWRQYVFISQRATYNDACLRQIATFLSDENRLRRELRKHAQATLQ